MHNTVQHPIRFFSLALTLFLFTQHALAQPSLWQGNRTENTIAMEVLVPNFSDNAASYSAFILTLSSALVVGPKTQLVLELPIASGNYSVFSIDESETMIGNPYIGFRFVPLESLFWGEVGVRIPIAPEDYPIALTAGALTDADRIEAYIPDILQISGAVNFSTQFSPPFGIRLRLGPAIDLGLDDQSTGDAFLHYAALLQCSISAIELQGGYVAKTLMTRSGVGNRTRDFIEFHGATQIQQIRPGIQIRLPLSEFDEMLLDAVYGVELGITF